MQPAAYILHGCASCALAYVAQGRTHNYCVGLVVNEKNAPERKRSDSDKP